MPQAVMLLTTRILRKPAEPAKNMMIHGFAGLGGLPDLAARINPARRPQDEKTRFAICEHRFFSRFIFFRATGVPGLSGTTASDVTRRFY